MQNIRRYFYNLMTDRDECPCSYPVKIFLWVLSLIYGLVLFIRDVFYRLDFIESKSIPEVKVISVGNITVGGTGKTPLVKKMANLLKEKGKKVAVLLRGYGQDEYAMLKNFLGDIPVIKGKDRVKSAREAVDKYTTDTLILDDAFQYRKLKKDFSILLIDARNPFGNNHLLPRGILRERISRLKSADMIILTKTGTNLSGVLPLEKKIKSLSYKTGIFFAYHRPIDLYDIVNKQSVSLDFLKHKKIAVLSSIGDPEYFKDMLQNLDARIILTFPFLDHHNYKRKEIERIVSLCKNHIVNTIVTTEKDAAKLNQFSLGKEIKFLSFRIKVDFRKDEDKFINRLLGIYSG